MSQSSGPRIFVVDDERVIALTLAMILCHQGYDARSFTLPLDALEAARSMPPDLLISDVMMPQLSGVELAIEFEKLCPDCRILLFSGQAATGNLLSAARADGHDFELLQKPVDPTVLLSKVQRMVAVPPPRPRNHDLQAGL